MSGKNTLRPACVAAGSLLSAILLLSALPGEWFRNPAKARSVGVAPANTQPALNFKCIEDIRVGDRVIADNPDLHGGKRFSGTRVDPTTWKKIRLYAESVWDDGTVDDIRVETLQPPEWLEARHIRVGSAVAMPLNLVEMGIPSSLKATVVGIEACPPIKDGPGEVVLTTVNHLNKYVLDLTVADQRGRQQTIGVTGFHKIYSESRKAWVSASELRAGENLVGLDGSRISVVTTVKRPTTHRVYNMTVETEHVYHVSSFGILVHNNNCSQDVIDALMPNGSPIGTPGRGDQVQLVQGTMDDAEDLFLNLVSNGTDITPSNHPGILVELPEGGIVGYRPVSNSGPPTIDTHSLDVPIKEIKFDPAHAVGNR
jgi:hypothetical protein